MWFQGQFRSGADRFIVDEHFECSRSGNFQRAFCVAVAVQVERIEMQGISFFGCRDGNQSGGIRIDNDRIAEGAAERNSRFDQVLCLERLAIDVQAVCQDGLVDRYRPGMKVLHHFYVFCRLGGESRKEE